MRSSVIIAAALAAAAQAAPAVVTVTDVVDVYTTVTEGAAPAATQGKWNWNGNGNWGKSSTTTEAAAAPAPTTTTTEAPAPATTTSVAPASSSQAAAQSGSASVGNTGAPNGDVYAQRVIDHHNIHRANHSAGTMTWDNNLAEIALQIANSCVYAHNTAVGGISYGQNIAAGAPADNITSVITDLFYNNEMPNYGSMYGEATPSSINDDSAFDMYGHFTQIVWKGSNTCGCATVDCTGKGNGPQGLGNVGADVPPFFTVCNYGPAGNYLGEFADNVGEPLGHPTVDWSYMY